jgi:predicted RNase H-like HicB family nuclease
VAWAAGDEGKMKLYKLPIVIYEPSEDTEWKYMAEMPTLPGCRAWGDTVSETLDLIRGNAEIFVDSYLDRESPLPEGMESLLYDPAGSVIHGEIIVTA